MQAYLAQLLHKIILCVYNQCTLITGLLDRQFPLMYHYCEPTFNKASYIHLLVNTQTLCSAIDSWLNAVPQIASGLILLGSVAGLPSLHGVENERCFVDRVQLLSLGEYRVEEDEYEGEADAIDHQYDQRLHPS